MARHLLCHPSVDRPRAGIADEWGKRPVDFDRPRAGIADKWGKRPVDFDRPRAGIADEWGKRPVDLAGAIGTGAAAAAWRGDAVS